MGAWCAGDEGPPLIPDPVREPLPPAPGFRPKAPPRPPTLRGGLKDRARPDPRVLDPAPPLGWVLRCAFYGLLPRSSAHPSPPLAGELRHRFLFSLGEACAELCLARLERLVEEVLYERLKDEPPVPLHPDLAWIELPY